MARKLTDEVQLKLRFAEELRRRIERAAEANGRSMNSEIIHRLDQSFIKDTSLSLASQTVERIIADHNIDGVVAAKLMRLLIGLKLGPDAFEGSAMAQPERRGAGQTRGREG
jgi:uncharacterized protein (DUF1778 family)